MIPNKIKNPEDKESKFLSTEFKQSFLLEFTKQLILNSAPMEVLKLREVLEEKKYADKTDEEIRKEKIKEKVREVIELEEGSAYEKSDMPKTQNLEKSWAKPVLKRKSFPFESFRNVRLTIPESNLPERLRYLRPTPTNQDIDLGKLNPLIKDPFVKSIECLGPDTNILVRGKMGEKQTKIILDSEEVNQIIKKFSEESKIPAEEGVYKVAVGRLIFMAIVSEVVGSKFIINKMLSPRMMAPPMPFR